MSFLQCRNDRFFIIGHSGSSVPDTTVPQFRTRRFLNSGHAGSSVPDIPVLQFRTRQFFSSGHAGSSVPNTSVLHLMMEQTKSCECHYHVVAVGGFDDIIIPNRSAGMCHILYSALKCSLDVISKREESIRAKSYISVLVKPCSLFSLSKYRRLLLEDVLPLAVCEYIHIVSSDVQIDSIVSVRAPDIVKKRQIKYLRSLTKEPVVSL